MTARVWQAMAEHFLDTETRPSIPHTALVCIEHDFDPLRAKAIWRDQVVPVVGRNLLSILGEWAMWDSAWLEREILALRPGWALSFKKRCLGWIVKDTWAAIETCMDLLVDYPPQSRPLVAKALEHLGCIYFDMSLEPTMALEPQLRAWVLRLYPSPMLELFAMVTRDDERSQAQSRVERALMGVVSPSSEPLV